MVRVCLIIQWWCISCSTKIRFSDISTSLTVIGSLVSISCRSWLIMMASRRSLRPRGLHVLVYRVVVPCYDFLSRGSTTFITCFSVGCHWVWCDQHCLRLCCKVVHLRCQPCIDHDGQHIAVLFTPFEYVRVPQFVGVFPDMGTTY